MSELWLLTKSLKKWTEFLKSNNKQAMRIFDADTHMSPYRNTDFSLNGKEWNDTLDKAGIEKAVCWLMPQGVDNVSESNRYIYEQSKIYSKMIPFGWANVGGEGLEKSLSDVEICLKEYGFVGVKINGAQNEYYIDGDNAKTVALKIAELGGILAYHIGADAPDYTSPFRAAKIAKQIPNTPVLMIHMGGAIPEDISESVIAVAKECPNMVLIGSAIKEDKVANAIRELGDDRILFGSDTPFFNAEEHIAKYRELEAEFGSETMEKLFWGNAARLFKLK